MNGSAFSLVLKVRVLDIGYGLIGYEWNEARIVESKTSDQMVYYLQLYPSFDENIRKKSIFTQVEDASLYEISNLISAVFHLNCSFRILCWI